jgi:hypothetical protein
MEALSIIGLVSSILTFVDYGLKAVNTATSIYNSASGVSAANAQLEEATQRLRTIAARLETDHTNLRADEGHDALRECAVSCRKQCDELLSLLDALKSKRPGSKRYAVQATIKGMWKRKASGELAATLKRQQEQLHFVMDSIARLVLVISVVQAAGVRPFC